MKYGQKRAQQKLIGSVASAGHNYRERGQLRAWAKRALRRRSPSARNIYAPPYPPSPSQPIRQRRYGR